MLQNPQEAVHTLLFNHVGVTTEGERPDGWRCQSRETVTLTQLPALHWKSEGGKKRAGTLKGAVVHAVL